MKIDEAMMCLNCSEVFHEQYDGCPVCMSVNVYRIDDWLSRKGAQVHGAVTGDIRKGPPVAYIGGLHSSKQSSGQASPACSR